MNKDKKTVDCPKHGNSLPLEERDGKLVAICNCFTGTVKNNWKGQVVYSTDLPKKRTTKKRAPRAQKGKVNNG